MKTMSRIIRTTFFISLLTLNTSSLALSTTNLAQGVTQERLVIELIDTSASNLTYSNIRYQGANRAAGIFTGGIIDGLGIERGIVLSTGDIANAIGPNQCFKTETVNGWPGDGHLETIVGYGATGDATVLEFDFIPAGDHLQFNYVFASEEYNEWVNSLFNDVFGFFLNGKNIALVPNTQTAVAINTINNRSFSSLYKDNAYPSPPVSFQYLITPCSPGDYTPFRSEFDGFTHVLTATAKVIPGTRYHIKLAIADTGDYSLDSAVFIQGKSFATPVTTPSPPPEPPPIVYPPKVTPPPLTTCKLYAVQDYDLNDSQFIDFEQTDNTLTPLGESYMGYDIEALDAHPQTQELYVVSGNNSHMESGQLYQLNPNEGQLTHLGRLTFETGDLIEDVTDLSFHPNNNILWGWAGEHGLFRIENFPENTVVQLKWANKKQFSGLTWDETGSGLYLAQKNQLWRFDGEQMTALCRLAEHQEIESLEIMPSGTLLMGIHDEAHIYQLDTKTISEHETCAITAFETAVLQEQSDIEGLAWVCTTQ